MHGAGRHLAAGLLFVFERNLPQEAMGRSGVVQLVASAVCIGYYRGWVYRLVFDGKFSRRSSIEESAQSHSLSWDR